MMRLGGTCSDTIFWAGTSSRITSVVLSGMLFQQVDLCHLRHHHPFVSQWLHGIDLAGNGVGRLGRADSDVLQADTQSQLRPIFDHRFPSRATA